MKRWVVIFGLAGFVALILLTISARRNLQLVGSAADATSRQGAAIAIEEKPTLEEIRAGSFAFFDQNGLPRVGYSESSNRISLYKLPASSSGNGDKILPMTREKADSYVRMLETRAAAVKQAEEAQLAKARQDKLVEEIQKSQADEEQKKINDAKAALRAAEEKERNRIAESNAVVKARRDLELYRDHYLALNASFDRAVLIIDEQNNQNMPLSSLIAEIFTAHGAKTTPALFKPAFFKDGVFGKVFAGQTDEAKRLAFTNVSRAVVFGRQNVNYSTNPNLNEVVTATMTLDLSAASASDLQPISGQTLRSIGAGLSRNEARQTAEERMISQLTNGVLAKIDQILSR